MVRHQTLMLLALTLAMAACTRQRQQRPLRSGEILHGGGSVAQKITAMERRLHSLEQKQRAAATVARVTAPKPDARPPADADARVKVAAASPAPAVAPAACTCAAGAAGKPGAPGPAGPAGPVGPAGEAGATGLSGQPGGQGPRGLQGPPGVQGVPGPRGVQGLAGPPGTYGARAQLYRASGRLTLSAGLNGAVVATCRKTTDLLISGGCAAEPPWLGALGRTSAVDLATKDRAAGWRCEFRNLSATRAITINAAAYCVPGS